MLLTRIRTVLRSPETLTDAMLASVVLLRALYDMRNSPTGSLVDVKPAGAPADTSRPLDAVKVQHARRWERAMRRAVRVLPVTTTCLGRAVALHRLLNRRNVTGSQVCIGVQREAGEFTAHAWVELDGLLLGDSRDAVQKWTPFGRASVAGAMPPAKERS